MKPFGVILLLFCLCAATEGTVVPILTQGYNSLFGRQAVDTRPIVGTREEIRLVKERFPEYANRQFLEVPSRYLGRHVVEPEAPAPAYGKPVSPDHNKPGSNYPRPAPSSAYGKPEQPIDLGEPQPVPEAAELPSVNEGSSPNWVSDNDRNNEASISQTASSSSPDASISQTASISNHAGDSDPAGGSAETPESPSEQKDNNANSVLQEVSVEQTASSGSDVDFFPARLPTAEIVPPTVSDNVIRPASRPASSESQEPISENTIDFGKPALVHQEASIEQNVNAAPETDSALVENTPSLSDNVIRPASRPASVPETPVNQETDAPAESASSAEIDQSASSDSGSVVQDASIVQNAPIGQNALIEQNASIEQNADAGVPSGSAGPTSVADDHAEGPASEHVGNAGDSQVSDSDADLFLVNHTKTENTFNETKIAHNTTKQVSTTFVTSDPASVIGALPTNIEQLPGEKLQHPFLKQARKIIPKKLQNPGSREIFGRSADLSDGDLVDSSQSSVDAEDETAAEEDQEFDLRQLADNYPVLEKQEDIEDYFTYVATHDTNHCLAKIICELASNPTKKGTEAVQIDEFFEKYDATNSKDGMKMYKDAHVAGKNGEEICLARFPDCKLED